MNLGMKLDNYIIDIMQLNRKKPWYKVYSYYFIKKHMKENKSLIESAYNCKYIFKWQYEKLLKLRDQLHHTNIIHNN